MLRNHRQIHLPVCRRHQGLTLLECLLASVILAFAATAAAFALSASAQQQRYGQEQTIAAQLATQLLERIIARPYASAGGDTLTRLGITSADTANAMHGYSDSVNADGQAVSSTAQNRYQRQVRVESAAAAGLSVGGDIGLVTVDVVTPTGRRLRWRRLLADR